ncbi:MAG: shikimate dehydrogenase [Candidatus Omnitrophota bacterium]
MNDFAVIIHPVNLELLHFFDPGTYRKGRENLIKKVLEWTPAFKASHVSGARSITGKEIDGYLIMCPLLPDQILNMDSKLVLKKVIEAGKIAESLKVKIIGLGAYVALAGRKGVFVQRNLNTPVTTGTSYTIAIVLENVLKISKEVGLRLENMHITVIGATGAIGSICSSILSEKVGSLNLVARNNHRLENLAYNLCKNKKNTAKIRISDNIRKSLHSADIIISATNTPEALIDVNLLKPGTIVCDISQPHNISEEKATLKEDLLVIDGGVVRPPGDVEFNFNFGLTSGTAFACIAETMILAFEERYESYSIGGRIVRQKVKEISRLATKHGFKLTEFRSFGKEIMREKIEKIKQIRKTVKNTTMCF